MFLLKHHDRDLPGVIFFLMFLTISWHFIYAKVGDRKHRKIDFKKSLVFWNRNNELFKCLQLWYTEYLVKMPSVFPSTPLKNLSLVDRVRTNSDRSVSGKGGK